MEELNKQEWNYNPTVPIQNNPAFTFPLIFKKIFKWYTNMWAPLSETVFCLFVGIIYFLLHPPVMLFENLNFNSILTIYLFNITIMIVVAGGLHLFFYTLKKQNNHLKYDDRIVSKSKKFTFNYQILDNMFWSLTSGVTIWTFYQILILWSYANGFITQINFNINPFWFLAIFF